MKKTILCFCGVLITLGLTNCNDSKNDQLATIDNKDVAINVEAKEKIEKRIFSDFIYGVGPRFNPIKKSDLDKVRSINDFFEEEHVQRIVEYKSVNIVIIKDDKHTDVGKTGSSGILTDAQLEFFKSLDYSTNFKVSAYLYQKNKETGELEYSHWTSYHTIIPEKQAEYEFGKDVLMDYLKVNSKEAIADANVDEEKLQAAKLFFTITKNGIIENVKLDRSSNYPTIDKFMVELIKQVPGEWKPAENQEGEKVDQELAVSFGLMGC